MYYKYIKKKLIQANLKKMIQVILKRMFKK